jgi:cytochrome c oxidase assembly protein subunit 11
LLVVAMVGLAFAAVPALPHLLPGDGLGGTTMRATETAAAMVKPVAGKSVSVRFDANVSRDLLWDSSRTRPSAPSPIGARNMSVYTARTARAARSPAPRPSTSRPSRPGQYFSKVQCFCFQEQTLQPGQEVQMPVVFYVDPAILDDPAARDITEITLSYTFYPVEQPGPRS